MNLPKPRRRPRRPRPPALGARFAAPGETVPGVGPFTELVVVRVNPDGTVNLAETDTNRPHVTLHPMVDPARLVRLGA